MKALEKPTKTHSSKRDPRKHPRPGYDEKFPNKKFPVNSTIYPKKIKK